MALKMNSKNRKNLLYLRIKQINMNDPFGEAISDFFEKGKAPAIKVNSNYTTDEKIPVSWFFRSEKEMPAMEQTALKLCRGKILDVGAAAGCHSLILQKKGFDVTALEISELAAEILKKRGLTQVVCQDIYKFQNHRFDTILMLMNGTGIGGTVEGLANLMAHFKNLLSENGQILVDSSDIKYLFTEDDDSVWVDLTNAAYYGEMTYTISYKKSKSTFPWLYIDFESLSNLARTLGFRCKLIKKGSHFDYLASLSLKTNPDS